MLSYALFLLQLLGIFLLLASIKFYGFGFLTILSVLVLFALVVFSNIRLIKKSGKHDYSAFTIEPLSFAAHQLKSPLSIIKGFADLIADGTYGEINNSIKETAIKIKDSADRSLKIINEVLSFKYFESGRMPHNSESLSINLFLKERLSEYEATALKKGLALVFKPSSEEIILKADPLQLHHIIDNLLDNAIKYTDKGKIEIQTSVKSGKALLEISDTGKGIPKDFIKKLFVPFEREPSHARDSKGIGLGLSIVKKLVEANGGEIFVESEGEGKGAKFSIKFYLS